MHTILITDPASDEAIKYLEENSLKVCYQPSISPSDLKEKIKDAFGLMVRSRTKVTSEVIQNGVNLRVVGRIGSGYDNIEIDACRKRGIKVVNAPDANSVAVAELTVGLVISMFRDIPRALDSMAEGLWIKNEIWGREVAGKTVGIVGYGYVGTKVEKIFSSMGADILIYSRSYKTATLEEVFRKSDIVTIHLALTAETEKIINSHLLGLMKSDAILVNISRGPIIDEDDLYNLLVKKKIKGAILDVYWDEPLPPDSRWRQLENVILTPHIGAATKEALVKASLYVARDIVKISKGGKPDNQVV